jgi:hypothetical protein
MIVDPNTADVTARVLEMLEFVHNLSLKSN